jgi:hypothetical protein
MDSLLSWLYVKKMSGYPKDSALSGPLFGEYGLVI